VNWIDILWAILPLFDHVVCVRNWASHYKLRLVNYILTVGIIIYCVEMMQTITHLSKPGYLFRMLTWAIQASYIAFASTAYGQNPG
jgi:uncharacterized membrane protein YiaA